MKPARIFYGWRVVAVAFLMAMFAWGLGFYGPSVYVNELVRTRGWPVAVVSAAVTFHFLFSAFLILGLAEAHARLGLVTVTRIGIVAFALGAVGWAHAFEPWQLFIAAALTGIGWSALSGAAINAFVSPWFQARRGIALSHAYNGASMGGVVFSPLWAGLITAYGFTSASIIIAIGGTLLLWPLAGHYFSKTPQTLGLAPDGETPAATAARSVDDAPARSRRALIADWRFLSLSLAFSIGIFAQMGLITHLIVHLTPTLGAAGAALALSMATACAMIGRIVLGAAIHVDNRRAAGAANFLMQAVGTLLLIEGSTPPVLLAGTVLFGLGIGNLLSLPPLILQAEQRAIDVPRALALLTAINQFVYAFAPGTIGHLRDTTGDYVIPFALIGIVQIASAALVMTAKQRG